jgi:hypothetical protein
VLLPIATPLLILLAASAACALLRSSGGSGKASMQCRWPGAAAIAPAAVAIAVATCGQAAAALYWFAQQTPASAITDFSSSSSAPSHASVLSRLLLSLLRQLVGSAATAHGAHAPAHATAHASVLEASPLLRLGLPRAVYAATLLSLAALTALGLLRRKQLHSRLRAAAGSGSATSLDSSGAAAAPALLLWWPALLFCCALPSLSLLLGHGSPILLLCMPLHALGLAVLRLLASGVGNSSEAEPAEEAVTAAAAAPASLLRRVGACIGNLLTSPLTAHSLALSWSSCHYYLASGHGNQFNSLHFSAPFVGFDTYHPVGSTLLLLANTLAAHITFFGLFALDFTATATLFGRLPPPLRVPTLRGRFAADSVTPRPRPSGDAPGVLALVLPNAVALLCTSIFCCIARRHLMVWAIFAPKFVFDTLHFAAAVGIALVARTTAAVAAGFM